MIYPARCKDFANIVQGDDEAQGVDETFLLSLEYALPPTGGWGLGKLSTILHSNQEFC